jgi:TolB-like protein/DNA-binding winged helix-turn-helix (wHTH) protein/tetratricopeptide (TPR) repeat protein
MTFRMQTLVHQTRTFDGFTLDLTRGCLLRGTEEIKLAPKPFEALKHLVENPGRLISKTELIETIWPDTAVTDDSLVQCLREVRRALHDEAQQVVKTVPRRGYIFDRPVTSGPTALTTYSEEKGVQLIIEEEEETNGHASALPVAGRVSLLPERKATIVQRVGTAVSRHKWATAVGALTLAIAAAGIFYFTRPAEAIDSVAVMPFVNVSGDPNTDYLSDGISDSIIDSLSQLPSLKTVIARSSVLRYKGKQMDPQVVGRELNVRAVLMGQVVKRGDDISISVELVDVRDNKHLWGAQYNRKLADVTAVPTEIAQNIAQGLRLRLSGEEKKRLAKRYTDNVEAYQLYLMGRSYSYTRSVKGLQKSIELYEQAIKKDPNYAPAYAGLSLTYETLGFQGLLPAKEARQKEEWAALKAMELDDMLAEAHVAVALVRRLDLNWSADEEEGKRALELDPNSVRAHVTYAYHLVWLGRLDEAMPHVKRAQELDPLSLITSAEIGNILTCSRQYDRAIEQFQKIIQMDPNSALAHTRLGMTYLAKGMYEEAIDEHKKAIALDDAPRRTALLGHAYAVAGRKAEAQKILDDLKELAKQRPVSAYDFALIYMGLGDKDQAFVWLEKTIEERPDVLWDINVGPRFDPLRSDPRFTDLLRRLKLAA